MKLTIAGAALTIAAVAFSAIGNDTAASTATSSTLSWDISMWDTAGLCPGHGTNDGNGKIEQEECPDVTSVFWIQPGGGSGGTQPMFDSANIIWMTGPLSSDVTGDGKADPQHGLAPNAPETWGAKVGMVTLACSQPGTRTCSEQHRRRRQRKDSALLGSHRAAGPTSTATRVWTLVAGGLVQLWNAVPDERYGLRPRRR
jgi:hypothetical protein